MEQNSEALLLGERTIFLIPGWRGRGSGMKKGASRQAGGVIISYYMYPIYKNFSKIKKKSSILLQQLHPVAKHTTNTAEEFKVCFFRQPPPPSLPPCWKISSRGGIFFQPKLEFLILADSGRKEIMVVCRKHREEFFESSSPRHHRYRWHV